MDRVDVKPRMIEWAFERSGMDLSDLAKRFPKLPEWLDGETKPTFKQLEEFSKATLAPFGAFFLADPPNEHLPVPDFRTVGNAAPRRPTAPLLETIHQMQRRQEWLRDYLEETGMAPLPFVGSVTIESRPEDVAAMIRTALGINQGWAAEHGTWESALLGLRRSAEALGMMVVVNGCVGNNTSQKLNPDEFRGFVLCDRIAPLIFVNGADWKAAQMFTLAHELAHLWIGSGALFNLHQLRPSTHEVERFCNRVAAEVLVPAEELRAAWPSAKDSPEVFRLLSRRFKVSEIVIARRLLDLGLISQERFLSIWQETANREARKKQEKESGGDFYKSQIVRVGYLFGGAVVRAAREGRLLYQEAYRLTGLHGKTFDRFAEEIGFGTP